MSFFRLKTYNSHMKEHYMDGARGCLTNVLAVNLLEKIRPLVEGAVTEAALADAAVRDRDRLE
jgi:hypothetical protein